MTQTNFTPPPAPPSVSLLIWGAILMASGIAIGAGGTLLLHRPPPPPPPRDDVAMVNEPPMRGPGPEERPGPIVDRLKVELKLDDAQAAKVLTAYTESLDAITKLRQDMVVNLSAAHDKLRQAMHDILTPLQFAMWEQRYESMRSRMMPGGPPLGPLDGRGPRRGPPGGPGGGPGFGGPQGRGPGGPEGRGPGGPPRGPEDFSGPGPGPGGPPTQP